MVCNKVLVDDMQPITAQEYQSTSSFISGQFMSWWSANQNVERRLWGVMDKKSPLGDIDKPGSCVISDHVTL